MQTTKANVLYAGADLHGNNVFLSVCDAGGTEVFRRRVKTDLDAVNTALNPYWPNIQQMGVESTFNWYWFVDGLRAQGRNVTLGNPAQMKQYSGLKSTDDRSDARWLAELVRLGIFPQSYIYPEDIRAVRDALRRRQLFVGGEGFAPIDTVNGEVELVMGVAESGRHFVGIVKLRHRLFRMLFPLFQNIPHMHRDRLLLLLRQLRDWEIVVTNS